MGAKPTKPCPQTRLDVEAFIEQMDSFRGDNGPGDQYMGEFIVNWKGKKQTFDMTTALRFRHCSSKPNLFLIVLLSDSSLYLQHKIKGSIYYYSFKLDANLVQKLERKWKSEHGKKSCQ